MSKRKNSERLIECWAKDFCDLSGVAAHSNNRKTDRFVWSEFWHLAFASILFPLLVKARLAELGCLEIKEIEKEHLNFIEHYLAIDPNPKDSAEIGTNHPWLEIEGFIQDSLLTKDLHESFGKILDYYPRLIYPPFSELY